MWERVACESLSCLVDPLWGHVLRLFSAEETRAYCQT